MSLPKQIHTVTHVPSYSSSPSKSSLRSQKSGPQQPRSLLPSPHFENNPEIHVTERESLDEGEEVAEEGPQDLEVEHEDEAPHNLQPFFTLLHDTQTFEHYHPTVHYIFADDDPDIITDAALYSLSAEDTAEGDEPSGSGQHSKINRHYLLIDVARTATTTSSSIHPAAQTSNQPSSSSSNATARPPPTLETTAQYPYHITSASSLSPSFAVLSAEIIAAPTFESPVATTTLAAAVAVKRRSGSILGVDGGPTAQGLGIYNTTGAAGGSPHLGTAVFPEENIPLMLKIQGMSSFDYDSHEDENKYPSSKSKSKSKAKSKVTKGKAPEGTSEDIPTTTGEANDEETLEDLVLRFEQRLREIKSVVDAGTGIGPGTGIEHNETGDGGIQYATLQEEGEQEIESCEIGADAGVEVETKPEIENPMPPIGIEVVGNESEADDDR